MTHDTATIDRILSRAQKMLDLADSTSFAAEAATANAMARKLLAKYGLSIEDATAGDSAVIESEFQHYDKAVWARFLWHDIADFYFCRYIHRKVVNQARQAFHVLVGKPHDIRVAREMTMYIYTSITRFARDAKVDWEGKFSTSSYCQGAAAAVTSNLATLRAAERRDGEDSEDADSGAGTDMVVKYGAQAREDVDEFLSASSMALDLEEATVNYKETEFAVGYKDGLTIGLDKQIGVK